MNFQFNNTTVSVNTDTIDILTPNDSVVNDLRIVQTTKKKFKYKCVIDKAVNTKKKYKLVYYLINQNQKVLNLTNPCVKLLEAKKLMKTLVNLDNTTIYIVPMKTVVEGNKFVFRGVLEFRNESPEFKLVVS